MGMGSPYARVVEYDLSQVIPNFKGVTGAIVIDSAKGEVGKLHFASSEAQFIKQAGEPNPKKFGTYIYSALNALQQTNSLFWARVDKGQTYASSLVRAKIGKTVIKDDYCYLLENPVVDPIVKPNGALSKEQIESFVFPEYPRTREIGHFNPAVHLAIIPEVGDTKFYIDNVSDIEVGDYVSFKDTTGMDRDTAMFYQYYQVNEVGSEVVYVDWILTQDSIPTSTPNGTEIKKRIKLGNNVGATLAADANSGDTTITVNDGSLFSVGDKIVFSVDASGDVYEITSIDTNTLTLSSTLTENVSSGEVVYKYVEQSLSYNYPVYVKWVDVANDKRLMVSSNDPIAEGDMVDINGVITTVTSKYQTNNRTNYIKVDKEYVNDANPIVGSEVYKVVHTDWEERDAFLVYAESPGEWGNKIAIAIRDSKEYEKAFWVDVYYDGILEESFHVTMEYFIDGYGRQMFIEDVINNRSRYIRVKINPLMVDDEGNPVEPLKTLYYYKQKQKEALYYKVATAVETIWDGDNYIRVNHEDIVNIDVTKKIQVGDKAYDIAEITKSCENCPYDTVVLKEAISLGLDNLPPLDRKLDIGTELKQSFDRAKIVDIIVSSYNDGGTYNVTVKGNPEEKCETKTYTYTSQSGDNEEAVLNALANDINSDNNKWVDASVITVNGTKTLRLVADVAGNDYDVETSDNMVAAVTVENARAWKINPLEKVDGKILPTTTIGAIVTQNGVTYIIRDAGANRTSGGDDAGFPTVGQFLKALDLFKNREEVDFLVFMDAGVTDVSYAQAITQMCEKRKDCIGLLSVSFDAQANPDIQKVVKYRQDLHINSSYVALYAPWVQITDKYNDINIFIPPESFAFQAVCTVDRERELWYPPFGWKSGKVYARKVYRVYTKGERDLLYDNQINALRVHPNKGIAIWGQKNLQVISSATDRINVRLLLIVIERALLETLDGFIGEINEEYTRRQLKDMVDKYLYNIQSRKGVYGFRTVCDESNNDSYVIANHELVIDVYVEPVEGIEYPLGRVAVTPQGMAKISHI